MFSAIKSKPKTEVLSPQKMVNIRCWIGSLHSIKNNKIIEEMSNLQTKSPQYCSMCTHQHISIMNESAGFGGTRSVNITRWCYFSLSPSLSRSLSLANIANATLTHTRARSLHAHTHMYVCTGPVAKGSLAEGRGKRATTEQQRALISLKKYFLDSISPFLICVQTESLPLSLLLSCDCSISHSLSLFFLAVHLRYSLMCLL